MQILPARENKKKSDNDKLDGVASTGVPSPIVMANAS